MADDIVERLNGWPLTVTGDGWVKLLDEAAAEIERLRAERDAIDALHQPDPDYYSPRDRQMCLNCDLEWPCPTYELLHPKEARRG